MWTLFWLNYRSVAEFQLWTVSYHFSKFTINWMHKSKRFLKRLSQTQFSIRKCFVYVNQFTINMIILECKLQHNFFEWNKIQMESEVWCKRCRYGNFSYLSFAWDSHINIQKTTVKLHKTSEKKPPEITIMIAFAQFHFMILWTTPLLSIAKI